MKPICEANCGNRTQVYGSKHCPGCHKRYTPAYSGLQFMPACELPNIRDEHADFLLLNQCDGYHMATPWFDNDGNFKYFEDSFREVYFTMDSYCAWAKLPDPVKELHPIFIEALAND